MMEPIKKIAGDLLLFFYAQQRKRGFPDENIIEFGNAENMGVVVKKSTSIEGIMTVCKGSSTDAYNAIQYLREKSFIECNESDETNGILIYGIRVTAQGVDIVEGVERDKEGRDMFYITFNIKLADNINVESLIKNEVDAIFKLGLV